MKLRSLFICAGVALGVAAIAAPVYRPNKVGAFYSSDGSGGDGTWLPMAGVGGTGAAVGRVSPAGLYYSSDGTGHDGTWIPCPANCFGGSGSGTVNAGTLNQLAFYAAAGTAVSGSSAIPNGITATTQTAADNTTKVATDAFVQTALNTLPNGATATTQTTGDTSTKVATDQFVANSAVTLTQWISPGQKSGAAGINANITRIYDFFIPANITATKITYSVQTADNSANLYDLGIYSATGTLLCHIGATAGTTFAPATGVRTLSFLSSCSLPGGPRYIFAITSNATVALLDASGAVILAYANVQPGTGSVTSGGVLNGSITPPADSYNSGTGFPLISLHS